MRTNHHQGEATPEILTVETVESFLTHSGVVSDSLATRIEAAADTMYDLLYRATEDDYQRKTWAPKLTDEQRQDLKALYKGVCRMVLLERVARNWSKEPFNRAGKDSEG